jgi:hypothetical protein
MAGGGGLLRRARERSRGCFIGSRRVETVSPHLRGLQELKHGHGGDGDVPRTGGQWRMVVRLPASAHRARGTGLGHLRASIALGAQWRRRGPQTAGSSGASACARGQATARPTWRASGATSCEFALWLETDSSSPFKINFLQTFKQKCTKLEYQSCSTTYPLQYCQRL